MKEQKRNEKYLSIYFNLDDPEQKALYEFAGGSKRIKRILQREMEGKEQNPNSPILSNQTDLEHEVFFDDAFSLV